MRFMAVLKDMPMQFPLAHSPVARSHYTASAEPDKPSPYEPPSDLTPGQNVRTHTLLEKDDVTFRREIVWDADDLETPKIVLNRIVVETGDGADQVHVRTWAGDKLQFTINGKSYLLDATQKEGPEQGLWIKTNGGNDSVIIDDDVKIRVDVDGGDGDDCMQAGGGRTRLYGEHGNDFLRLGSGLGYAEGNDGDDTMIGGTGNAVMYGNKGRDRMYGGLGSATKQSHLDGGDDEDQMYSGNGHTVMHGGNGDDLMVGHDRTTFYTGKGKDRIWNNRLKDRIYAGANDVFDRTQGSAFTEVKPTNAGQQGFRVEGAEDFQQHVADDFEFFRSSPLGQQALKQMDRLAESTGGQVTVSESSFGSEYQYYSAQLDNSTPEDDQIGYSAQGYFLNGVPGSPADLAWIDYNPAAIQESADRTFIITPAITLFHEIGHGYNGVTGTRLTGKTTERPEPGKSFSVENEERQVVGLPSDADPIDLDNDPSTPPDTINPKPFTENALHEEMGKSSRPGYAFRPSAQGAGI